MDIILSLSSFCAITLITPGPNNIMLMSSGLTFGLRKTIPHMIGVPLGFAIMVFSVGFGIGTLFKTWPFLYPFLKYGGATYLIFLALKIAMSGPIDTSNNVRGKPMTILQAMAFQWINPKAWMMSISVTSAYSEISFFPLNITIISLIYGTLGFISSGTWAAFGFALQRIISSPSAIRSFNVIMSVLLVASLYPIFHEEQ